MGILKRVMGGRVSVCFALGCVLSYVLAPPLLAQLTTGEEPYTFVNPVEMSDPPTVIMPAFSPYEALFEEADNPARPQKVAHEFEVSYDVREDGAWHELPSGDRIWRLSIVSEGALSISLGYDKFHLPPGGKLHVYSEDHKHVIGAMTARNNRGSSNQPGDYASAAIRGERTILEYYEPASARNKTVLSVGWVYHVFRDFGKLQFSGMGQPLGAINDSQVDCNIDVNCRQAHGWSIEKRSVFYLVVRGSGCTGVLANVTARDGSMYAITGYECVANKDVDNPANPSAAALPGFGLAVAYWDREVSEGNCGKQEDHIVPSVEIRQRATVGARMLTGFPLQNLAVISLNENPVTHSRPYRVFYTGWDVRRELNAKPGDRFFSILHPANGDVKKWAILNYVGVSKPVGDVGITPSLTPVEVARTLDEAHYLQLSSASTYIAGSVEGASAQGSPLFNEDRYLLGTLFKSIGVGLCEEEKELHYGWLPQVWEDNREKGGVRPGTERFLVSNGRLFGKFKELEGLDPCEIKSDVIKTKGEKLALEKICTPSVEFFRILEMNENSFKVALALDEDVDELFWVVQGKSFTLSPNHRQLREGKDGRVIRGEDLEADGSGTLKREGLVKAHRKVVLTFTNKGGTAKEGAPFTMPERQENELFLVFASKATGLLSSIRAYTFPKYSGPPYNLDAYALPDPPAIDKEAIAVGTSNVSFEVVYGSRAKVLWIILPSDAPPVFTVERLEEYKNVPRDNFDIGASVPYLAEVENLDPFEEYTIYAGICGKTCEVEGKDKDSEVLPVPFRTLLPKELDFEIKAKLKSISEKQVIVDIDSYEGGILHWSLIHKDQPVPKTLQQLADGESVAGGKSDGRILPRTDTPVVVRGFELNTDYIFCYVVVNRRQVSSIKTMPFTIYEPNLDISYGGSGSGAASLEVKSPAKGHFFWVVYHEGRRRVPKTLEDLRKIDVTKSSHKDSLRIRAAGESYEIQVQPLISGIEYNMYYTIDHDNILKTPAIQKFPFTFGSAFSSQNKPTRVRREMPFLHPNPSSEDLLHFRFHEPVEQAFVYSLQGKVLREEKAYPLNSMDISTLPRGVYVVEIRYDGGAQRAISRFIREAP